MFSLQVIISGNPADSTPDGSRVTLVYDAVGQQTTMEDSTGRYTTTYDPLGRRASVIQPAGQIIAHNYEIRGYDARGVDHPIRRNGWVTKSQEAFILRMQTGVDLPHMIARS